MSLPRWAQDLAQAVTVHPHLALWGNVRDLFLVPHESQEAMAGLLETAHLALSDRGYNALLVYDPVTGLRVVPSGPDAAEAASEVAEREVAGEPTACSREQLLDIMRRVAVGADRRVGLVIDYASRLVDDPERLTEDELAFFTTAQQQAHRATAVPGSDGASAVYNPVIWVAEEESDLPSWLLGSDDSVRTLPVAEPQLRDRVRAGRLLTGLLTGPDDSEEETAQSLADLTHGMTLRAVRDVVRLARDRGFGPDELEQAVRAYKVGVMDDPWRQAELRERVVDGERSARESIIGQESAITHAFDIVKRSVTGLSGAQAGARSRRPRGVLLLAGPTGTGKTELAKHLTEAVFGVRDAYVRFDMSEFRQEQAEARLLGAPPGYVGYGSGGELTRPVREQPFRLLLFDEMEKAHERVMDNFLQILDDGRLTDGQGDTVHFTETLIVFTTNLGVIQADEHGRPQQRLTPDDPPEEVEARIRDAIVHHFEHQLNRPELVTRLGDNIVVFDFIRSEHAPSIFDMQVNNVRERVREEHGVSLELDERARQQLLEACSAELARGARGMQVVLESQLVNPLARWVFENDGVDRSPLTVSGIHSTDRGVGIDIA
jgi:ATP-dependent Clp protease ATP-binding subunit ClpA